MTLEKETLLQDLQETFQSAIKQLDSIDTATIIFKESGWTARDIIDHIAMWEEEKVKGLEAFFEGDVYLTPDFSSDELHDYNRRLRDARLECGIEDVFAAWRSIRHRLIAVVEAMPDNQLKSAMTPPWGGAETMRALAVAQDAIRHQNEHMAQILAVCAKEAR